MPLDLVIIGFLSTHIPLFPRRASTAPRSGTMLPSYIAASPLHAAHLLEGSEEDIAESRMTREAIQGALVTVSLILGIPVLRSRDAEESAKLMLYAGH